MVDICVPWLRIIFQSTLPVRGATFNYLADAISAMISIHAPRAGSDRRLILGKERGNDFNPRSPCGERRFTVQMCCYAGIFQSTLPVRGATLQSEKYTSLLMISIHAPRAGSDFPAVISETLTHIFQSTLPVRGATRHSPNQPQTLKNFNPRSPCGERRRVYTLDTYMDQFQSTLPVRGATRDNAVSLQSILISIHAPRAGSDYSSLCSVAALRRFQSTLPVRGATAIFHRFSRKKRQYCNTVTKRGLSSGRKASF